jgi:hypothetical protein
MTPCCRRRGYLSAFIGMVSAIDRKHCPPSIGTAVRLHRNPHFTTSEQESQHPRLRIDGAYPFGPPANSDAGFASRDFDAETPEHELALARKLYGEDPSELWFKPYGVQNHRSANTPATNNPIPYRYWQLANRWGTPSPRVILTPTVTMGTLMATISIEILHRAASRNN